MTPNDIFAIIFFWILSTTLIIALAAHTARKKRDNLLSVMSYDKVMEYWGKVEDLDPYTLDMTLIYVRKKIRRELND